MNNIIKTAQNWLNQDPDSGTRHELQTLIDENNLEELKKRFSGRLQFGTAGLRGRLQAGSMGMNRVLVAQTAAGFARFLLAREDKDNQSNLSIVIGYDARRKSRIFAQDTAEIMQAAGISAYIMPDLRPTPVLAFAIRHMQATAGIMVTASHNPPEDNGYKVFLGGDDDGSQIVSPDDKSITKQILWVAAHQTVDEIPRNNNYGIIEQSVIDTYIEQTASLRKSPVKPLKYVYTAMHGVGTETLLATLEKAGLPKPILVNEQCEPDGRFPTVTFPNPEEDGALDLALATAENSNAKFILANDPDADRLGVSVVDENGKWLNLHGNDIGLYLAWHVAKQAQKEGKQGVLACSLVSSPTLAKVAENCGLQHTETMTGFKWIGRVPNLLFGYEEALGYLTDPDKVHDKDGISAIISFLDLINQLSSEGKTFNDHRQEFTKTYGAVTSDQLSVRVEDIGRIQRILTRIREQPFTEIAGLEVLNYVDHRQTESKENILVFSLQDNQRVIFRPSGTEPKLKVYLDATAENLTKAQEISANLKQYLNDYVIQID